MKQNLCSCKSQKPYKECCQRFHEGVPADNALALMRSRYSAYALGLADYIIQTTHPTNPAYTKDSESWKKQILDFSQNTRFEGLQIREFTEDKDKATVTFTAYLLSGGQDVTFTEKSFFVKEGDRWYYQDGVRVIPA